MKVQTPIKPSTRGVGSKPLPAPNSDFYQLADAAVVARSQGGGSPYGPGHLAGGDNRREIDPQEAAICRALGRRLAEVGLRLQTK